MTTATENTCTEEFIPTGEEVPTEEPLSETQAEAEVEQVAAELGPNELEAALDELRPTLLAIPPDEVRRILVDSTYSVAIGLRVAEAFGADGARIAEFFSPEKFEVSDYDDLATRALALWQADILLTRAEKGEGAGAALLEDARATRNDLLSAAEYLYTDHPELGSVVAHIRTGHSKMDVADDLASLVNLFREQWDDARENSRVTEQELDAATDLCQRLIRVSTVTSRSEEVEDALDLRNRAAEHLRRGIDDVRSAARFVFRDDPERFASYPSLFSGRKRKPTSSQSSQEEVVEPPPDSETTAVESPTAPEPVDIPPVTA